MRESLEAWMRSAEAWRSDAGRERMVCFATIFGDWDFLLSSSGRVDGN